jgi:hypothetical protein
LSIVQRLRGASVCKVFFKQFWNTGRAVEHIFQGCVAYAP